MSTEPVSPKDSEAGSTPAAELLKNVRAILQRELVEGKTAEEVAVSLAVTKPQAKAWLGQFVAEGMLEKIKKTTPPRYRVLSGSSRLL